MIIISFALLDSFVKYEFGPNSYPVLCTDTEVMALLFINGIWAIGAFS